MYNGWLVAQSKHGSILLNILALLFEYKTFFLFFKIRIETEIVSKAFVAVIRKDRSFWQCVSFHLKSINFRKSYVSNRIREIGNACPSMRSSYHCTVQQKLQFHVEHKLHRHKIIESPLNGASIDIELNLSRQCWWAKKKGVHFSWTISAQNLDW